MPKRFIISSLFRLLEEFRNNPFMNIREHDYQALLFSSLRQHISDPVPVKFTIAPNGPKNLSFSWINEMTSRVHREATFGKKGKKGSSVKVDLVVLHKQSI